MENNVDYTLAIRNIKQNYDRVKYACEIAQSVTEIAAVDSLIDLVILLKNMPVEVIEQALPIIA